MKIYTKKGDKGETSLIGGTRVSKSHIRIETYGTVDELNSYIGLLSVQPVNESRKNILTDIQHKLFTIGTSLASDPQKSKTRIPDLTDQDVENLEKEIDKMDEKLPELKSFILPGGNQQVAFCHISRCVCRRAERLVTALLISNRDGSSSSSEHEFVADHVIKYLNRLSDYLFVLARKMGQELNAEEIYWKPRK